MSDPKADILAVFNSNPATKTDAANGIGQAIIDYVGAPGITPASTVQALDGSSAVGTSSNYAREDHKHSDADRPSAGEKAALAGTSGTPGLANKYVTDADPRLAGGGAPASASYITTAAEAGLSAETVLGSGVIMRGTLASRPAAGVSGRLYFVTDAADERWTRDNGVSWDDTGDDWDFITGKPSTFAPSSHTHPESDVTSLVADLAAKQPLDATLTALAGYGATAGLLEKTALDTFTERAIGVAAPTSIPTRADGDTRYAAASHSHPESDVTSLVADLAAKEVAANKGAASGYASLDATTRLPVAQLPEFLVTNPSPVSDVSVPAGYNAFADEEVFIADGKEIALLDGASLVIL